MQTKAIYSQLWLAATKERKRNDTQSTKRIWPSASFKPSLRTATRTNSMSYCNTTLTRKAWTTGLVKHFSCSIQRRQTIDSRLSHPLTCAIQTKIWKSGQISKLRRMRRAKPLTMKVTAIAMVRACLYSQSKSAYFATNTVSWCTQARLIRGTSIIKTWCCRCKYNAFTSSMVLHHRR